MTKGVLFDIRRAQVWQRLYKSKVKVKPFSHGNLKVAKTLPLLARLPAESGFFMDKIRCVDYKVDGIHVKVLQDPTKPLSPRAVKNIQDYVRKMKEQGNA